MARFKRCIHCGEYVMEVGGRLRTVDASQSILCMDNPDRHHEVK